MSCWLREVGRVSEKEKETHFGEQTAHVQSAEDDRGDVELEFVVCS